jgi:hypothetical protein
MDAHLIVDVAVLVSHPCKTVEYKVVEDAGVGRFVHLATAHDGPAM